MSDPRRATRVALLRFFTLVGTASLGACAPEYPPPPPSARGNVSDTIHGDVIPDPYRWLEDQESAQTRHWIDEQNAYAEQIIGETPLRERLRSRLRELMDIDEIGEPKKGGDYEYFSLRRIGEELSSIYRREAPSDNELIRIEPDGDYDLVLDPHGMSDDQTTQVEILSVSSDGNLLLYSVREGGQDEVEIRLRDVERGVDLEEKLPRALYSSVSFESRGDGFHYVRRSRETGPRVMFHRLGSSTEEDDVLFGEEYGPRSFINVMESSDGAYLVFTVRNGWARSEIYLKDVKREGRARALTAPGADARFYASFGASRLLARTNLDAPNNRILAMDLSDPGPESWRELIPEGEDVLQDFALLDEKLYLTYLRDVSHEIRVFELNGSPAGEIEVPEHTRATIRAAAPGKAFLTLESFLRPEVTTLLDLESADGELWRDHEEPFDPEGFVVEQVWYESKDGTRVPMYLVHAKELALSGDSPTLLFGYGGFNVAQTPRFDPLAAVWIEQGGVFAMANVRGGSEYGERWHRAGMLENKQNVFDDFIAAGEWLIANRYTSPERLAIRGVSNGGLLVASVLTQRPELFRAVSCGFPDLDMVRFYRFTDTNNMPALLEYGDAEKADQFEFLRKYSPYQAVEEGKRYPAVMLMSGDLDTRVPPLQARKMTARLQGASSSGLPVILRYQSKAGHAAHRGLPLSRNIEDRAAELSFLMTQLGVNHP